SEAGSKVGATASLRQVIPERAKDRISGGVAISIGGLLETVKIEQKKGEGGSFSLAADNFSFYTRLRKPAIVQPCQRVEHRHTVENFRTGLLSLNLVPEVLNPEL